MDDATRKCPYCAEDIPVAAVRCRYCRSRLAALDPAHWYRDHPDRRLGGVAVALARALTVPVAVARVGFIALAFFHLLGPIIYAALWLVIPFRPGGEAPFERAVGLVRTFFGNDDEPHDVHQGDSAAGRVSGGPHA